MTKKIKRAPGAHKLALMIACIAVTIASVIFARPETVRAETQNYTVTIDMQGGTMIQLSDATVSADGSTESFTVTLGLQNYWIRIAPTRTGYTFAGYYTEPNGGGEKVYGTRVGDHIYALGGIYWTPDHFWQYNGNLKLYARWIPDAYDGQYDGRYFIIRTAGNQSYALNIYGSSLVSGTNVHIWDVSKYATDPGFVWQFESDGNGYYWIKNAKQKDLVLDVYGAADASLPDNTNIQICDKNGGYNQRWKIQDNGDGTVTLISAARLTAAMDVYNDNYASGANVALWATNSRTNQKWVLDDVSTYVSFDANGGSGTMGTQIINPLAGDTLAANAFTKTVTAHFDTNGGKDIADQSYTLPFKWWKSEAEQLYEDTPSIEQQGSSTGTWSVDSDGVYTLNNDSLNVSGWGDSASFPNYCIFITPREARIPHNAGVSYEFDMQMTRGQIDTEMFDYNAYAIDHSNWNGNDNDEKRMLYVNGTKSGIYDSHISPLSNTWEHVTAETWNTASANTDHAALRFQPALGVGTASTSGTTLQFKNFHPYLLYPDQFAVTSFTGVPNGTLIAQWESKDITLSTPERTGYTFVLWKGSDGKEYHAGDTVALSDNITFTAQWTPNHYTVHFDANGGAGTMADQAFTYDTAQALNANQFTHTGYVFAGYNTAKSGSGTAYSNGQSVNNLSATDGASITLYAQWHQLTFSGWNTEPDGSGTMYQPGDPLPDENLDLYAQWKYDPTMLTTGQKFNAAIKTLAAGADKKYSDKDTLIKSIRVVDTMPSENITTKDVSANQDGSYLAWWDADTSTIGLYSKSGSIVLNPDSDWMFYNCGKLTALDVSGWNTSQITNMHLMFSNCNSLTTLDVSSWNTSKVTDMSGMFNDCSSLTTLGVSGWNTSQVKDMGLMFSGCSKLITLDVSKWNTGSVTGMYGMFTGCSSLTTLNVSGWNTSRVTNMSSMFGDFFGGCRSLTVLDLSKWDTSQVTNMGSMFQLCSNLTTIYIGKGWNTGQVTSSYCMFGGCTNLPNFNSSVIDKTNAYAGAGGYMTLKS